MADRHKVRWGVLGAAGIALKKVIPAMQKCERGTIDAIASRDLAKAHEAARSLGIPKAYGSYEELLADPSIDAIYNPLPNHLHVPWSIRAAEAGKHVLCEKPIGLSVARDSRIDRRARQGRRENRRGVHGAHASAMAARRGNCRTPVASASCAWSPVTSVTSIATRKMSAISPTSAAEGSWTSAATRSTSHA